MWYLIVSIPDLCTLSYFVPKGMRVNLKIHLGEDSDESQTVVNKLLEKTLLEITREGRDEHTKTAN